MNLFQSVYFARKRLDNIIKFQIRYFCNKFGNIISEPVRYYINMSFTLHKYSYYFFLYIRKFRQIADFFGFGRIFGTFRNFGNGFRFNIRFICFRNDFIIIKKIEISCYIFIAVNRNCTVTEKFYISRKLLSYIFAGGTQKTSLFCSRASSAVISEPLFSPASTTTTPRLNPESIRFLFGKFC